MSSAITGLHKALLTEGTTDAEYKTMAKQHGVSQLVTAAKTEAVALKVIDQFLPDPEYFTANPAGAANSARVNFDAQHIGKSGVESDPTREVFIQDHKEGKTVAVIKGNLVKLAVGAEKEYFSGIGGFFLKILSFVHTTDTMKEIQGLRALADRNLEEIKQ